MKPSLLYKVSAVLLVLFAGTHTYGMYHPPSSRAAVDAVTFAMRNVHFDVMGFNRSMWDFYFGFGMLLTVFLLFSAVLSWHLGAPTKERAAGLLAWSFAACHCAVGVLCWMYFFLAPAIASTVIAVCLVAAAAQRQG